MNSDGIIDFGKLEKELYAAVEEDAKYQRENDAKFRAVEQKVASYEEFKDIVAASHLKPLDKNDREGLNNRKQPWNPYADNQKGKPVQKLDKQVSDTIKVPKNSHEFLKQWRQYESSGHEKYCFLVKIGGPQLCEIFKTEISMGLLGEIIEVLQENWTIDDQINIYEILYNLSTVKRFTLSLQFLNKKETEALERLINALERCFIDENKERDTQLDISEKSFERLKEIYHL